jgi:phenylpropionate dioxygenase-like ring-hydroxylating dioxygenase large terminal subunit
MSGAEGFKREDYSLLSYRHDLWQGFIMVNLDGKASDLTEQLAGMSAIVDPYGLADYQTVATTDWGTCPWDWKIMVDNFMECYHHMGPHRQSLEAEFPARLSWIDQGGDNYSVMWSEQADGYPAKAPFLLPLQDGLPENRHRSSLIFIAYPLLQVAMGPAYMYWLRVMPTGAGEISLKLDISMSAAALAAPDAEANKAVLIENIKKIHSEDIDACTRVQAALNSGAGGVGRLSLLEQALFEFYQYLGRCLDIEGLTARSTNTLHAAGEQYAEAG